MTDREAIAIYIENVVRINSADSPEVITNVALEKSEDRGKRGKSLKQKE